MCGSRTVSRACGPPRSGRRPGCAETRDGGATWRGDDSGLRHHYLWGLAVDPGDPATVVISAARGPQQAHNPHAAASTLYRRVGDDPWQEVRAGLPEEQGTIAAVLAGNAAEPGVVYAVSNHGLFRSPDAGQSWERLALDWPERYRRQRPHALVVVETA